MAESSSSTDPIALHAITVLVPLALEAAAKSNPDFADRLLMAAERCKVERSVEAAKVAANVAKAAYNEAKVTTRDAASAYTDAIAASNVAKADPKADAANIAKVDAVTAKARVAYTVAAHASNVARAAYAEALAATDDR